MYCRPLYQTHRMRPLRDDVVEDGNHGSVSGDDQQHHSDLLCNPLQEQCHILISPNDDNKKEQTISSSLPSYVQHQPPDDKLPFQFTPIEIIQTEKKISKWRSFSFYTNYDLKQNQQFMKSDLLQTPKKTNYYKDSRCGTNINNQNGQGERQNENQDEGEGVQYENNNYYVNHTDVSDSNTNNNTQKRQNNENNLNHHIDRYNSTSNHNTYTNNNSKNLTSSSSIFTFGNKQSQSSPSLSSPTKTTTTIENDELATSYIDSQSPRESVYYSYPVTDQVNIKGNSYHNGSEENVLLDLTYSKYKSLMTHPYAYQLIKLQYHHLPQQPYFITPTPQDNFLLHYKSNTYPKQQSSIRQSIKEYLLQITDVMQQRQLISEVVSEILGEWVRLDQCEVEIQGECSRLMGQLDKYEQDMRNGNKEGVQHVIPILQPQHAVINNQEQAQVLESQYINEENKQLLFQLEQQQSACEEQLLKLNYQELLLTQQLQQVKQQQQQVNHQLKRSSNQLTYSQLTLSQLQHQHSLLVNSSQHHISHLSTCSSIVSTAIQYLQYNKIHNDLYTLSEQVFQLTFIVLQLANRQRDAVDNNDKNTVQQSVTRMRLCSLFTTNNQGTLTDQFVQQYLISRLKSDGKKMIIGSVEIIGLLEQQQQLKLPLLPSNNQKNSQTILQGILSQLVNTITILSSQPQNNLIQLYTLLQKAIRNYFISKINHHCLSPYKSHTLKLVPNALMTELYNLIDGNSYHSDKIKQHLFNFNGQYLQFVKQAFYQLITDNLPVNIHDHSKHKRL